MLDAVVFLSALGIIETVERADQIAGDAADTLKAHALADQLLLHYFFFHDSTLPFSILDNLQCIGQTVGLLGGIAVIAKRHTVQMFVKPELLQLG